MKFDILGGCVSRDAFSIVQNNYEINNYFARSSIISLYSPPIDINMSSIDLDSQFQSRMVYNDLTKKFSKYIKNSGSDFLVVDLLMERLSLFKYKNSYFTRSNEYLKSNLNLKAEEVNRIEIETGLWFKKANSFIKDLNNYGQEKVVLHKVFLKESYRDKKGEIQKFENLIGIRLINSLLAGYYNYLEQNLKKINVIDLTNQFVPDEGHRWGLAPYHFEKGYYYKFMENINSVVQKEM